MRASKSVTTTIRLEQLPAFGLPDKPDEPVYPIAKYLIHLASKTLPRPESSMELPSIDNLSLFFKCSVLELYDALRQLRTSGYDFKFSKCSQPLLVWRMSTKDLSTQRNNA